MGRGGGVVGEHALCGALSDSEVRLMCFEANFIKHIIFVTYPWMTRSDAALFGRGRGNSLPLHKKRRLKTPELQKASNSNRGKMLPLAMGLGVRGQLPFYPSRGSTTGCIH